MRRTTGLAAAAVVVLTTYGLLIGGTPAGVTLPTLRLATAMACIAVFLAWIVVAVRDPAWRPRSVLVPALVLALCSMALSTALSASVRISAENLAWATVLVGLYLLLVQLLARPVFRNRITFVAGVVGVLVAATYLSLVVAKWFEFWGLIGRIAAPPLRPDDAGLVFGNPALLMVVVVLLGSVFIGWSAGLGRGGQLVAVLAAGLVGVASLLSGTRAGWLAVGSGLAVVASLAVARPEGRRLVGLAIAAARRSRGRVAAAVSLSVAALAVVVVLGPAVLRRVGAGGEELRTSFYAEAWRTFIGAPLLGVGPGMWAFDRIANTLPQEVDRYVPHAHDVYLQGLAEMGIVGAAAGIVGIAFVVWLLRDGLSSPDRLRRRWAWVACFATVYLAVHEVLDFHLNVPTVLIAAALPIAMLDATAERGPASLRQLPSLAKRVGPVVAAAALVAALAFVVWIDSIALDGDRAVGAANSGDWATALPIAETASDRDPGMPAYELVAGLAEAQTGDLARAEATLSAFASRSGLPEAWVDVAALRLGAGDHSGAATALQEASRLGLQRPAVAVVIADIAVRLGDSARAVEAGANAIAQRPSLASDPWWTQDETRAAIFPAILRRAIDVADRDQRWEILLMTGDARGARDAAAGGSRPGEAAEIVAAWTGGGSAAQVVFDRCHADPLSGPIGWCARLASREGDEATAASYRRVAGLLITDPDTLGETRINLHPTEPALAGVVAYTYSVQVFRHLGLWNLLVPGLPHLETRLTW